MDSYTQRPGAQTWRDRRGRRDLTRRLGIADRLAFVHGDATSKSTVLWELGAIHGGRIVSCGDTEYDVTEALTAGAVAIGFSGGYRPGAALVEAGAVSVIDLFATLAEALLASR